MWDQLDSTTWNSFHLQTFPETFYTADLSDLFSTRRWFLPCGFVKKFLIRGRRNVGCTDIFRSCAYHGWACRVGVTMIKWFIFSLRIFLRTLLIKLDRRKAKLYSLSQGCRNTTLAILPRSDFHAMYRESWSLDANKLRVVPCILQSLGKLKHLFSKLNCPWLCPDTFRAPGRYSADISICLLRRKLEIQMDLLVCKSSLLCVSLIFEIYESAVLLSIRKWIAIFQCPFVNVRMSNFAAIVFRTFMCKFSPFPDHFYSVETSLQKASQPDLDASVCIAKFGFFCLSDLQFFNPKFSTHQRSSCFDRLFNTDSDWYEQACFSDCICCCCKCLSCRRDGWAAWRAADIRPINFVNSETVIEGEKGDFDISKLPFSSFAWLVPKSWCGCLFLGLKTLFAGMVSKLIFKIYDKTLMLSRKINVSQLISSNILPIRRISSRYITRRMFNRFNRAIATLIALKISREQALIQNKGRETLKDFPTKQISQTFLRSSTAALGNRDLSCRENLFRWEGISSNANLPFWNACIE